MICGSLTVECICISYVMSGSSRTLDRYVFYKKNMSNLTNSEVKSLGQIEKINPVLFNLLIRNLDIIKYDTSDGSSIFISEGDFSNYIFPHFEKRWAGYDAN